MYGTPAPLVGMGVGSISTELILLGITLMSRSIQKDIFPVPTPMGRRTIIFLPGIE